MQIRQRLRQATATDLPAIERALTAADLPVDGVAAGLSQFVVADDGAGVVGAAGIEWHGEHALLRSVVVTPAARGRGLARAMVGLLLERAAARRAGVYLLTNDADGYFAKLGFSVVGRAAVPPEIRASPEFASICPADATVMRRDATPMPPEGDAP